MNASDLTLFLSDQLSKLQPNTIIGSWKFEGKTNIAYGTRGGSWNPKDFPGYLFSLDGKKKQFVIRPVGSRGKETLAIESVHNTGQLINHGLTKGKSMRTANGITTIYESFSMTVGKGKVKEDIAKSFLTKHGLSPDGEVFSFEDVTLGIEPLVLGLLDWAVIRENAKNEIRKVQRNETKVVPLPVAEVEERNYPETSISYPSNQILYGPPGTGKTFHTINLALQVTGVDMEGLESREAIKEAYNEKKGQGEIIFTTFHQSLGYEDFIEGIKPKTKGSDVVYEVEDGIFKRIAKKARENWEKSQHLSDNFDDVWEKLKNEWLESETGEVEVQMARNTFFITNITDHHIEFRKSNGSTRHDLVISTLKEIYRGNIKRESGLGVYYNPLVARLNSYEVQTASTQLKQYVLIIDEINRGNVSGIFGELITLIEPDKRLGEPEAIELTLPYSDVQFGVPPNLHIIGTMNTADRSVESIDTALRRRFAFKEMLPKSELLTPSAMYCRLLWRYKDVDWEEEEYASKEESMLELFQADDQLWETRKDVWETMKKEQKPYYMEYFNKSHFHGVNLKNLLSTINDRIEALIDRDHTIGHAYLIDVDGVDSLKYAFQHKIIPLLQEYFYGDYRKIEMVIGSGFFDESAKKKKVTFAAHQGLVDQREKYQLLNVMDFEDHQLLDALEKMGVIAASSNGDSVQQELSHADVNGN